MARFYAQCTETSTLFASKWSTSWQIFDREWPDKQGEDQPICMCVSRREAFRIRDALNLSLERSVPS
jgi:hypothetical protein